MTKERVDLLRLAADDCEAEANTQLREAPNLGPTKERRNRMEAADIMKRVAALRAWADELEHHEPTGNPTVDEANFQLRRLNKMVEKLGEPKGSHPEDFCERCRRPNAKRWFAPSELWNKAHGEWDILCPVCFTELAVTAGIDPTGWEIRPENLERFVCQHAWEGRLDRDGLFVYCPKCTSCLPVNREAERG